MRLLFRAIVEVVRRPGLFLFILVPLSLVNYLVVIGLGDELAREFTGLNTTVVAAGLVVNLTLVLVSATIWHRAILHETRTIGLQSVPKFRNFLRYALRAAMITLIALPVILLTGILSSLGVNASAWAFDNNLYTVYFLVVEPLFIPTDGTGLFIPVTYAVLAVSLPSIAMGQQERIWPGAKYGLQRIGGIVVATAVPILVFERFERWLTFGSHTENFASGSPLFYFLIFIQVAAELLRFAIGIAVVTLLYREFLGQQAREKAEIFK